MSPSPLGKPIPIPAAYDPSILFPIPRAAARAQNPDLPEAMTGYDLWNLYEVSWLNARGKPEVRRARIVYPAASECIVESKSLKLYLGSLVMARFETEAAVRETIRRDLTAILGTPVLDVAFFRFDAPFPFAAIDAAESIDGADVAIDAYAYDPELLRVEACPDSEVSVLSNLLKTNCPITGQPDWATVRIRYRARRRVSGASLLKYLVSFRSHADFHEACCERIFTDLFTRISPATLSVKCHFTRRGGIDITPCRFFGTPPDTEYGIRYWRQ